MIDLTSLDNTYTNLKIIQIKRMLKEIKPDMRELSPSDVINISLITFAYLCESNFIVKDGNDLILDYKDDEVILDVNNLTIVLKFKNDMVNRIISVENEQGLDELLKPYNILKELIGDENEF